MAIVKPKLHGRAFYESIGSPKYVIAPMVDQSEFAWRLLTRSFLPPEKRQSILAYSPMLHAKLFSTDPAKYRRNHFEPLKPPHLLTIPGEAGHVDTTFAESDLYLDGNHNVGDRPLFVQFCANDPDAFLHAAKIVQPYCDAVDLNLGCPQGIARRGGYGAFLQESPDLIYKLINTLHRELDIPVTAKFRIRETKEKTLEYAKMILSAGASIITVHGRRREQKGHNTGLADWEMLRYLRDNLPPETVIFANGNILQHDDIEQCLEMTKADGVMSAEGNLYDPTIFADPPPVGQEGREYFRDRNGKGGFRMDAVLRRYLDIIHQYGLGQGPPVREPLFLPSDLTAEERVQALKDLRSAKDDEAQDSERPAKRHKGESTETNGGEDSAAPKTKKQAKREMKKTEKARPFEKSNNTNFTAMQAHCFHMLRALVSKHHNVRDALARCRVGDIDAFENVLTLTEAAVKQGLLEYDENPDSFEAVDEEPVDLKISPEESSIEAVKRCRRPFFVCQPYVRPLPVEAFAKGSLQLSKKELKRRAEESENGVIHETLAPADPSAVGLVGKEKAVEQETLSALRESDPAAAQDAGNQKVAADGLVCG